MKSDKGFTLMETMVAIFIAGIISLGLMMYTISVLHHKKTDDVVRVTEQYANDVTELICHKIKNCDSLVIIRDNRNIMAFDLYTYNELRNETQRKQIRCYSAQGVREGNDWLLGMQLSDYTVTQVQDHSSLMYISYFTVTMPEYDWMKNNYYCTFMIGLTCVIDDYKFPEIVSVKQQVFLKNYHIITTS